MKHQNHTKLIKTTYTLKGLSCPNCLIKLENSINEISEIENAQIVFATQKLSIETKESENSNTILPKIKSIIKKIEPDVEIIEDKDLSHHSHAHNQSSAKKEIIVLFLGAILFVSGLLIPINFTLTINFTLKFILFGLSYIITGHKVLYSAFRNITRREFFDENLLMCIATLGAFAIGEFPEAAAVMLFYKTGELLEDIAVTKTRNSIKSLMSIKPDYANLVTLESISKVSPESVNIGDIILVNPGERVPLDGVVIDGQSDFDTSAITGESIPSHIGIDEELLSGSINQTSPVKFRVTRTFQQSTVSRILELVENSVSQKAPQEKFITKFAKIYTPTVVFLASFIAFIPPILLGTHEFSTWIHRALIFLVISCPCALVISIPLAYFAGIGAASSMGILVKGGNYLDALSKLKTVVFDKTGTLTKGNFTVSQIHSLDEFDNDTLLEIAAYCEYHSNHPIAKSIIASYKKEIAPNRISNFVYIPGMGVETTIDSNHVYCGNKQLLKSLKNPSIIEQLTKNSLLQESLNEENIVHLVINQNYAGYIVLKDTLKPDSIKAVKWLNELGITDVSMLTGDNENAAKTVASEVGISNYYHSLLPEHKVEIFKKLKGTSPDNITAFVGDGINDAPVLAISDIGISMGGLGQDMAIEVSDIVIMTDEPSKIALGVLIARKTRKIAWQNIILSFIIKLVVLALGTFGLATMWEAVFADVGVTILAIFNSTRILRKINFI